MDAEQQVRSTIANVLDIDESEVVPSANLRSDLDADSLELLDLLQELDKNFDQEVTDEEAQNLKTVGDVIALVKERTADATNANGSAASQ